MDLTGLFKKAALVESDDGSDWQFQFNVSAKQMLADDLDFVNKNRGRSVEISVYPDLSSDYETPAEKKHRIEQEKYDQMMREKKTRQAELALDQAEKKIEEPEQPPSICIPGRKTLHHSDYLNEAGDRYHLAPVEGDKDRWCVARLIAATGAVELAIKAPEPATIVEAGIELRRLAETNELTPVAPVGYGAVYDNDNGWFVGVFAHLNEDDDPDGFMSSHFDSSGLTGNFLDEVFSTPQDAQATLDAIWEDRLLKFFAYIEFPPTESEEVASEQAEQVGMAYQDDDENVYAVEHVQPSEDAEDFYYAVMMTTPSGESEELDHTAEEYSGLITSENAQEVQDALDAFAAGAGWYAVPASAPSKSDGQDVDIDQADAENALHDALMAAPGAKERWAELVCNGAADADINHQLVNEFGGGPNDGSTNGWDAGVDGGEPYFSKTPEHPAWTGLQLISAVRAILNIPYPAGSEPELAEPDTTAEPPEVSNAPESQAEAVETAAEVPATTPQSVTFEDVTINVGNILLRKGHPETCGKVLAADEVQGMYVQFGDDNPHWVTLASVVDHYDVMPEAGLALV